VIEVFVNFSFVRMSSRLCKEGLRSVVGG
jgi:hypothetical protein